MDDNEARDVVRGLRDGSVDAWRALYDAFAERVWHGVARLVGPNSAEIADVVQETMIAAARSARTFDAARARCGPGCGASPGSRSRLHYRKQKRHDRLKQAGAWLAASNGRLDRWLDGTDTTPGHLLEAAELALLVRSTLTELSNDYETLLTAKYLDGDSVEQIADREGITATAVRSKLARAREAFREAFGRTKSGSVYKAEAYHEPH